MRDQIDQEAAKQRAARARILLDDSILPEIWDGMEARHVEAMLSPNATDDDRRRAADRVNAIRDLRLELRQAVEAYATAKAPNNLP